MTTSTAASLPLLNYPDGTKYAQADTRMKAATPVSALRIALVNMPFASTRRPSIQLGLMKAIAEERGHNVATHYVNLHFAAQIGWDAYEVLCEGRDDLLGEWLFARAAFGENAPDGRPYLDAYREQLEKVAKEAGKDLEYLLTLREEIIPAFLSDCLDRFPWDQYDVVGFGSVFEQNCAALALARLLKSRHPEIVTIFGGSNFEDEMGLEYVRALPWIDYAVIGEGDDVFPALLHRLAAGEKQIEMAGVARRLPDGTVQSGGRAPMVSDLDALPEPDYTEFFTTSHEVKLPGVIRGKVVGLPFETARGCWWGAKHHCTFCGLNGFGMAFRSKSPERARAGIDQLANRHMIYAFAAVDNILDLRYIKDVFPKLIEDRLDYTFFYEVKANLSTEQLKVLARGGVRHLQPGIESLSTQVLKLMNKGTTGIQNVRMVKWAQYYGIRLSWNLLLGFPGERPEFYEQQLQTMRLIPHLQPPESIGRIWLERFSPNFTQAEERGFRNIRAQVAYGHVYPSEIEKERIAYFFDYEAPDTMADDAHAAQKEQVRWWREAWTTGRPPILGYQRGADRLTVTDGRVPGAPKIHIFDQQAALIYEFCGPTFHSPAQVLEYLQGQPGQQADAGAAQHALEEFVSLGLMLKEDDRHLSLALPANPNW